MSLGGQAVQQLLQQQQQQPAQQQQFQPPTQEQQSKTGGTDDNPVTSITDPRMTSADWARLSAGRDPTNQAGVPSNQWGPEGLAPPPGSPAAYDYWKRLQYGNSNGEIAPEFQNATPMDPSQWSDMYERMNQNVSSYGGGMQIPVGVSGSQFNPSKNNPNFTINSSGYGVLTGQGQQNLNQYAVDQLQSIYRNAAKNKSGLSGFLGTPMGGLTMLAMPAMIGGGAALLGGAGAGAVSAADAAGWSPMAGGIAGAGWSPIAGSEAIGGAAAAAPAASSGGGLLGSVGSFLADPYSAMGLPSWVNPAMKGLSAIHTLMQMASPPPQGGQG